MCARCVPFSRLNEHGCLLCLPARIDGLVLKQGTPFSQAVEIA